MNILCNLHTHSSFCDGADSPEEIVRAAIEKGCATIGFSSHAPSGIEGDDECLSESTVCDYRNEIVRLKALYADSIEIALGIEQDYFSPELKGGFDYVIGSAHYVEEGGAFVSVDLTYEHLRDGIRDYFENDPMKLAKKYYETVVDTVNKTNCDIVGHFDLLTKFNEKYAFLDETNLKYRSIALDALDALLDKGGLIFEVNTGAMTRGWLKRPYPNDFLVKRITERGGRLMISSDAHDKGALLSHFDEAEEYLRSCGAKETWIYQNGNFTPIKI